MGKAVDASANFYNPATMADFTNTVVTVGFVTEHPTADTVIDGRPGRKMDPGAFLLPHFHLVQPLPYDFAFGLGFAPEFGLGSHYNPGWALDWNTQKTTVRGLTLTPNLSYSITEDWSVSAGFRVLYFDFEQYSYQYTGARNLDGSLNRGRFRLKGDNGFTDWGWQLSTRYRITDTFSVGAMYKSYIDTKIKGEARMTGAGNAIVGMGPTGPIIANVNSIATGDASADIRLPQSVTIGANWDALDTLHLGTALTWTEWSSMPAINFRLPTGRKPTNLGWDDVFRIGFGGKVMSKADTDMTKIYSQVIPQDLVKFGLIPELVGRVPVLTTLDNLDKDALVRILTEPKNALVKQYEALFSMDNVSLEFQDGALEAIAELTLEKGTGARGLRAIMEKTLMPIMYETPSDTEVSKVIITTDTVKNGTAPIIEKASSSKNKTGGTNKTKG